MVYSFHQDKARYFNYQYQNSKEYIIPFVEPYFLSFENKKVLEIGCAEGGVLKAFIEKGCICTGIELHQSRIGHAKFFLENEIKKNKISFINRDIKNINPERDFKYKFDLIILKDVIEHIHNQSEVIEILKSFLNANGKIFFGFPPWYMPFGGHQQMCENKMLSVLPYYHLFPRTIYKSILQIFGESDIKIQNLLEIKDTGISIERFEKIVKRAGFKIKDTRYYLINPIYKFKFNLEPKEQYKLVSKLFYLRNFVTTTVFYLLG